MSLGDQRCQKSWKSQNWLGISLAPQSRTQSEQPAFQNSKATQGRKGNPAQI